MCLKCFGTLKNIWEIFSNFFIPHTHLGTYRTGLNYSLIHSYFCRWRYMPLSPYVFQCSSYFLRFCYSMIHLLHHSTITCYVYSEISVCFNFFIFLLFNLIFTPFSSPFFPNFIILLLVLFNSNFLFRHTFKFLY